MSQHIVWVTPIRRNNQCDRVRTLHEWWQHAVSKDHFVLQATIKAPAIGNMWKGITMAYALITSTYFSVAISGYWAFGQNCLPYLLNNLSNPSWPITIANLAAIVQITGCYQVSSDTFVICWLPWATTRLHLTCHYAPSIRVSGFWPSYTMAAAWAPNLLSMDQASSRGLWYKPNVLMLSHHTCLLSEFACLRMSPLPFYVISCSCIIYKLDTNAHHLRPWCCGSPVQIDLCSFLHESFLHCRSSAVQPMSPLNLGSATSTNPHSADATWQRVSVSLWLIMCWWHFWRRWSPSSLIL